ncbi:MAG: hypothetical protein HQ513_18170, partial [Rhodospirillales bacterium]|nr:hypothetical protein [Rhodospirillales bacterium]
GWKRIALYGISDLTEIMTLSARDFDLELVCVISGDVGVSEFAGLRVTPDMPGPNDADAIIICDFNDSQPAYDAVIGAFPAERVLAPKFLGIKTRSSGKGGQS